MSDEGAAERVAGHVAAAFAVDPVPWPFRHWLLRDVLPQPLLRGLGGVPDSGGMLGECGGRRETNNDARRFLRDTVAGGVDERLLVRAFQSATLVAALAERCVTPLEGTYLRIEYCRDVAGFWLEPHTDILVKRFTLVIYLNDPPAGEAWGTDLYDGTGRLMGRAPSQANAAIAFVPAADTWHGFSPRPITGVRRSLIVNYVDPTWRARHELAFPERPVRAD